MAKYKAPGIAVHQTIQQDAVTFLPDQDVAIVGPFASLSLYNASAAERAKAHRGKYVRGGPGSTSVYDWIRAIGDDKVDYDFTRVYLRDALLQYSPPAGVDVTVVANKFNQVTITGDFAALGRRVVAGDVVGMTVDGKKVVSAIHAVASITLDNTVTDEPMDGAAGNTSTGELTVSGSYSGQRDVTYVVEVIKGGGISGSDRAELRTLTTTGEDTSQEYLASSGATQNLGTRGLQFKVGATGTFVLGDKFMFTTTAVAESDTKVLTLRQNVPLQATDLTVKADFYVARDIEVSRQYFDQTTEHLKVSGEIFVTDFEFPGVPLPIAQGELYVESRIWGVPPTAAVGAGVCDTALDLEAALPGPIHPANPLKYAIYKALQNSGGRPVIYTVVKDPTDIESWNVSFNRLSKNRNAYAIVPLTDDPDVKRAAIAFVDAESSDQINRRKTCWIHQPLASSIPIIEFSFQKPTLATVIDNPDHETSDDMFNYVLTDTAEFVGAGVRAGDEFRTGFYTDIEGNVKWETRVIQRVINDVTLVLNAPFRRGVAEPQRFEIWRPTTSANFDENIGRINVWNNRRVIAVHPFALAADGYNISGFYGAAMVAALTSGLAPNRASTLMNLRGIDAIVGYEELSEHNLNDLAIKGVTILAQDDDGRVYVRHTITTGNFDILHEREEMSTRNFDNVSNFYTAVIARLRGRLTATIEGITAVFDALQKASDQLLLRYMDDGVSGQVVSYTIVNVKIDDNFHDVIVAHLDLELPRMANRIELYLQAVSDNSAVGVTLSAERTGGVYGMPGQTDR